MKSSIAALSMLVMSGCDGDSTVVTAPPYRGQPDIQPACSNPAPLSGQRGKAMEGWPTDYTFELVQRPDGSVDPAVLEYIKENYSSDLTPGGRNPHVTRWTATLSREAVARLRCEPAVVQVSHPPLMSFGH